MTGLYACNIADMTRDEILSALLIGPHIPRPHDIVQAERGRVDGMAVVLPCDDETAQNIIAVVRLRWPRSLFRFYRRKSTTARTWVRV